MDNPMVSHQERSDVVSSQIIIMRSHETKHYNPLKQRKWDRAVVVATAYLVSGKQHENYDY